ncbi:hypothetical protein GIB67_011864, partial [Kingdonia uniflora]
MDHTTHSLDSDSAVADTAGNIPSRTSSSSRRRGPSQGSKPLPDGKKKKVGVNSWCQPIRGVNSYLTTIGTLTRNHILINYKIFTNLTFDLRRVANFSILWHINDAWKRHKSRLNKKYIKGKDPAKVKATPPPFVPKEVWAEFVDICNSDSFQEKLQESMNLYPDSNKIGHDDVLTKDLDDHIKKHRQGVPQIQPSSSYNAPTNSSQATERKQSDLNRECKLNGCPEGIVTYGIVADVSPDAYCHNKHLVDGYYKIEIFNVITKMLYYLGKTVSLRQWQ